MFEIIVTGPGNIRFEAEADTIEGAALAAQTLYDEAYDLTVTGRAARSKVAVTIWHDLNLVARFEGHRP